jgi:plastocyanin
MHLRNVRASVLGVALAVTVAACGGGSEAPAGSAGAPAAPTGGQRVDSATAGSLSGTVSFEGDAPANEPIRMNADPFCVGANKTPQAQETYMVSNGKLGDVFVYVKDGLGNYVFDTPTTPVEIDQQACRYHPHVFGMMVGQTLQIVNSDATLHNIHATPTANQEFNTGQPIQGMKTTHVFSNPEIMVPFKCDVHGWMNAYVGVLPHPFFATTGADGSFTISGLPPGTYTIEAWHEKLGTKTQSVTISASQSATADFSFAASDAVSMN